MRRWMLRLSMTKWIVFASGYCDCQGDGHLSALKPRAIRGAKVK
jgi:hypothetical protein